MAKKALLVTVTFITRIVVDDDATDEAISESVKPNLLEKIFNNEIGENTTKVIKDLECPYGTFDGETETAAVEEGETKEYEVAVCRIGYAHTTFKVYAKSPLEAETLADEMAGGYEFSEKSSEYEIQSVIPTGK